LKQITSYLQQSRIAFISWSLIAAFGTYFCMYAFRKPFTAGTYSGYSHWGMDYKSILIIAQVFGYMFSKFIGIKVISELKPSQRRLLITVLILIAEVALVLFGMVGPYYNFIFLFLNGLPLGMVWGVVFSYLEGRRFTELLAMGLSISLIVSSGILKTVYFLVQGWFPMISEFWLPAVIGLLFLPFFLLFVWMLAMIPPPDETDIQLRTERTPMTNEDKKTVLRNFGPGVLSFVVIYIMLACMRDFRDNFSVEIWKEVGGVFDKTVFSRTELITSLVVLIAVGSLSLIKKNSKGFIGVQLLIGFGVTLSASSTLLFHQHLISPFWWMQLVGLGLFLAYIPMQIALFERMIALYKIKANAGFFVYICDSTGYLGSVALILYKEFFMRDLSWSKVLMNFSYSLAVVCLIFLVLAAVFFKRKRKAMKAAEAAGISQVI
jgi:hypothetical protein